MGRLIQGPQQRTASQGLAVEDKSTPSSNVSSSHLAREPIVGKIYYLPQQEDIHNASVIHKQKQEKHFFGHPIIVIGVEEDIAFFNCATTSRANAIKDLDMGLRVGTTPTNQGRMALRLNEGSSTFSRETWINLDQRYHIEWYNLREWDNDIRVRPDEIQDKLETRVRELEADQIRYIYKPLPRDLASLRPGTVIMLLNSLKSKTVGAPVLIVAQHSQCHYLRIKEFKGNKYFNPNAEGTKAQCAT
ncbi:hypothetical protein GMOD_00005251 [Pyrenophora seminiperda CCB06]|uniref:Uncharacterized protein n=1 Tax=Pyrenophora seminiperda CCB06 TaxID=1302712 RepID=A0A3M7LVC5_9PLEO|nr:hypothetical protein GMOD_00005251 [Pyrenophora seminiperda CCB06]